MTHARSRSFGLAFLAAITVALCLLLVASKSAVAADPVVVEMETSKGTIVLELNAEKAPKTVENFLKYVDKGHYDGTLFHRVIETFMIQGGGFDADFNKKETLPPVRNEAGNGLSNEPYTVAMARLGDPHSATSQFFISTVDNSRLDRGRYPDGYGYTVFGKVIEGKEVVDEIAKVATRSIPNPQNPAALMNDVPVEPVIIRSVESKG